MLERISAKWKKWSTQGMHVPFVFDPSTKSPSVTLMLVYVTSILSILSTIALHFKVELVVATITTLMFWLTAYILYLIRRITKAKIDLDDRSVELDGGEEKSGKETQQ